MYVRASERVRVRLIPCASVPVRVLPFGGGSLRPCACAFVRIIVNSDPSMGLDCASSRRVFHSRTFKMYYI